MANCLGVGVINRASCSQRNASFDIRSLTTEHRLQGVEARQYVSGAAAEAHKTYTPGDASERSQASADFQIEVVQQGASNGGVINTWRYIHQIELR
jgi:hypothetical protein